LSAAASVARRTAPKARAPLAPSASRSTRRGLLPKLTLACGSQGPRGPGALRRTSARRSSPQSKLADACVSEQNFNAAAWSHPSGTCRSHRVGTVVRFRALPGHRRCHLPLRKLPLTERLTTRGGAGLTGRGNWPCRASRPISFSEAFMAVFQLLPRSLAASRLS